MFRRSVVAWRGSTPCCASRRGWSLPDHPRLTLLDHARMVEVRLQTQTTEQLGGSRRPSGRLGVKPTALDGRIDARSCPSASLRCGLRSPEKGCRASDTAQGRAEALRRACLFARLGWPNPRRIRLLYSASDPTSGSLRMSRSRCCHRDGGMSLFSLFSFSSRTGQASHPRGLERSWDSRGGRGNDRMVARPAGLEPATIPLAGGRSFQLSYGRIDPVVPPSTSAAYISCSSRQAETLEHRETYERLLEWR